MVFHSIPLINLLRICTENKGFKIRVEMSWGDKQLDLIYILFGSRSPALSQSAMRMGSSDWAGI